MLESIQCQNAGFNKERLLSTKELLVGLKIAPSSRRAKEDEWLEPIHDVAQSY